ncbi:MAG: HlyD family secretion protein [Defluviitaleaceae bacterium]|nr:HlyD family secretion protein [Defluviitaleaceae bacterium]
MKIFKTIKITAVLLALNFLTGCDSQVAAPLPYIASYADIHSASSTASITVRGVVESIRSRNIYTTLGFTVSQVYAEIGDYVVEGQILAVLDVSGLELTIAQQNAALELARQNSQNLLTDSQRLLNEASVNLTNNTNPHVLSAEASLNAAMVNLETAQINHANALADYSERSDSLVLSAESAWESARIELNTRENTHRNLTALYDAGALSREELRQSETTFENVRNIYNNARTNYENAIAAQQRSLTQLEIALEAAITSHRNAQDALNAARTSSRQDIERLRSNAAGAEISTNLEHMEIALQILEKQLEDSIIRAPISGTVTAVIAREGAIGAGLLFTVEDTANLRIATSFREYDLSQVSEGMEVTITSDGTGNAEYIGVISRINPAANPAAPIVEFEAEVLVTSVDTNLRIGMTARVDIGVY